jgi:hypothetical protein
LKKAKVCGYKRPNYPTIDILKDNPEMLKVFPITWRRNPIISSALSFLLMTGCSYLKESSNNSKNSGEFIEVSQNLAELDKRESKLINQKKHAPIFEYGEGSGYTGCIVITPPVFLDEREALSIIKEVFKKLNVNQFYENIKFDSIYSNQKEIVSWEYNNENHIAENLIPKLIKFDLFFPEINLGVIYVDRWDHFTYPDVQISLDDERNRIEAFDMRLYGIGSVSTKEQAFFVNNILNEQDIINTVVFYDPVILTKEANTDSIYNLTSQDKIRIRQIKLKYRNLTDDEIDQIIDRQIYVPKLDKVFELEDYYSNIAKRKSVKKLNEQVQSFLKWAKENKLIGD